MSEDRDTPITADGNTNLRSVGAEPDSRCGLVAPPVQDVRSPMYHASASALRG